MVAQMSALTLAGHETTASTVSWLLYELANHPDFQDKIREEIVQKRSELIARGDPDFSMEDLESMESLQAAIKVRALPLSQDLPNLVFWALGNPSVPYHCLSPVERGVQR